LLSRSKIARYATYLSSLRVTLPVVTSSDQADKFQRLVERIDPRAKVVRTWPLTGGVSAQVTALEVEQPDGRVRKLIVRQHGEVDRRHNPHIARVEFKLLQIAQSHGLAAPKPYYVDESCDLFPLPFLVLSYVDGDTEFAPADLPGYLAQMARQLAKIHDVSDSPTLDFLPRQAKRFGERPASLDESLGEGRIRDAMESAWPLPQVNESVLLHGDYWPGNILWNDGKLAAVIDWEDARVGDPLADLGNCRLELLWAFGVEAMTDFTSRYHALTTIDFANLPYWDLRAALRPCGKLSKWGLDAATEQRMRARHKLFVDQADVAQGGTFLEGRDSM
jgi:aminoglycoside phosphotransferase (APT) family kinase protein